MGGGYAVSFTRTQWRSSYRWSVARRLPRTVVICVSVRCAAGGFADEARAMDGIMVRVEHPILCKVATLLVVKRP